MAVFNGAGDIQIPLAVLDPLSDHKLPAPGALAYGSITEDSALAGTTGHDTLLLLGNRDRQMTGSESTRITENRSHDVGGNQKKAITGNKNENVTGNWLHQTLGNHHFNIMGATNEVFVGAHNLAHKAKQILHEPVDFIHFVQTSTQKGNYYSSLYGRYLNTAGWYCNVIGQNLDFKVMQFGLTGIEANFAKLSTADKDVKIKASMVETSFREAHVMVGAVNPGLYVAMLHEVAFTQKIITVGVNQMI